VEAERVVVLGDQAVGEAEAGLHVVVDLPPCLAKGVIGKPVGRAGRLVSVVLDELDAQVFRVAGEHFPHSAGLVAA